MDPNNKDKKDSEKIREMFQKVADSKKSVAKDSVSLTHVETKKQQVSEETKKFANLLKEKLVEHDGFEELSNDELTILESFMGKRLFLSRIAIIANQSRIPLGIPGFTKQELEKILEGLIKKGYMESELVNDQRVYFLTERGKFRIQ